MIFCTRWSKTGRVLFVSVMFNLTHVFQGFFNMIRLTKWSDSEATQGLYAISGKTSYRKISWSLAAARFGFRLFRLLRPISQLRDLTRSCGKTSHRLLHRGPGSLHLVSRIIFRDLALMPWGIRINTSHESYKNNNDFVEFSVGQNWTLASSVFCWIMMTHEMPLYFARSRRPYDQNEVCGLLYWHELIWPQHEWVIISVTKSDIKLLIHSTLKRHNRDDVSWIEPDG